MKKLTTILLILIFPAFTNAARFYSSGFENNTTAAGEEWTNKSVTAPTIQTTTVRSGTYAMQVNANANRLVRHEWLGTAADDAVYLTFWFRIATSDNGLTKIVTWNTPAGTERASLRINSDDTLELWNASAQVGIDSSALSQNEWHKIDFFYDSTQTDGSDVLGVWIDNVSFISNSAQSLGTVGRVDLGIQAVTGSPNYFFDDISLNDTTGSSQYSRVLGTQGHMIHLRPDNQGDNNQWLHNNGSAGSATNTQEVDEVAPDDATTLVKTTVHNNIDDYSIQSATSTYSLNTYDLITLVQVGIRAVSTGKGIALRIKATSTGAVEESSTITFTSGAWRSHNDGLMNYQLTLYDEPGASSVAWTPTTLETAQIGIKYIDPAEAGITTSVTQEWLMVDYAIGTSPTAAAGIPKVPDIIIFEDE